MRTYRWTNALGVRATVECERLEIRDNRVEFIGPDGAFLSLHNDDVRRIEREL